VLDRDGYYSDGTSDEKGHAVRAQVLANLSSNLTVRIIGDYSHIGGMGPGATFTHSIRATPGSAATATSPANYTITPTGLDPRSGLLSPSNAAFFSNVFIGGPGINPAPLNRPFVHNDYYGISGELTWRTGLGDLTVIPAYRNSRVRSLFNGPAFRGGLVHEDLINSRWKRASRASGSDRSIGRSAGFILTNTSTVRRYSANIPSIRSRFFGPTTNPAPPMAD
jgi:iron complex outermembrane receptor protein